MRTNALGWTLLGLAASAACSGARAGEPGAHEPGAAVIRIPAYAESAPPAASDAPPPRAEPLPPPAEDPFPYFVGKWDGKANGKLQTALTVESDGAFRVSLEPTPQRGACDIDGHLRVGERVIYMDVAHSSCGAEASGSTLERFVTQKTEQEFTVRSGDGAMTVRYTRRR